LMESLLCVAFIILRYIVSILSLSLVSFFLLWYWDLNFRAFIMKGYQILLKAFFCIYWDDHVVMVVYVLYYLLFAIGIPSLNSKNETNLIIVYLFNVLLNSVWNHLIEKFCIYVQENWFIVFFLVFFPYLAS
jgi:hypothetical protein